MAESRPTGALANLYESRIGEPTTDDEVNGYWLFALGVLSGAIGVIVFAMTEAATMPRAVGYALVALSPPLVMIGAIVRFPLRRSATLLAGIGGLLTIGAIAYFLYVFPEGWSTATGNMTVNAVYAAGIVIIGLAGAVVPMITDPIREDYERMQTESAGTSAELDERSAELEETSAALDERSAELEETRTRIGELEEELAAAEAQIEAAHTSSARFELFEDRGGKHRWRLRHRNGNIIADGAQGYSSRQKCQQGMHSVMRNALGAGVLRIEAEPDVEEPQPDDADAPNLAVPAETEAVESQATFELFEDDAGEYRWRLRHDNGNTLGDSGEGYASKSNATRAMNRVREHVSAADYLRIDPTAFEIYRDSAGEYRWRLLHENGEILADSGEGYSSRSKARQGVDSVRSNVSDADVESE